MTSGLARRILYGIESAPQRVRGLRGRPPGSALRQHVRLFMNVKVRETLHCLHAMWPAQPIWSDGYRASSLGLSKIRSAARVIVCPMASRYAVVGCLRGRWP